MVNNIDKIKLFLMCFIFMCIGSVFVCLGLFPETLELKHVDYRTDAIISKKTIRIFSVKDNSKTITNVKQAVVETFKGSKGRDIYGVALQSYDGTRTPVFSYDDSFRSSKEELRDEINNAINKKLEFKYTDNKNSLTIIIVGLLFMFIPSTIVVLALFKGLEIRTKSGRIINSGSIRQEKSGNKYDNINDSIIK